LGRRGGRDEPILCYVYLTLRVEGKILLQVLTLGAAISLPLPASIMFPQLDTSFLVPHYILLFEEMAEEGTPLKKPRREDIAQTNAQAEGTEATSKELTLSNNNLLNEDSSPLHGANSPSHGKKRSAGALTTPEKSLIPETGSPPPRDEIVADDSLPIDHSDDEYIPEMNLDENAPHPPLCPAVPSERSTRWLTSAQEHGAAFKLGGADLSSALNLIPGMQILFTAYVTARESVPAQWPNNFSIRSRSRLLCGRI
jgi:hypothetical protein